MERRSSFVLPVALFALTAAGLTRAQEPQPIGEHGARIVLAKGWKRTLSSVTKTWQGCCFERRQGGGTFGRAAA